MGFKYLLVPGLQRAIGRVDETLRNPNIDDEARVSLLKSQSVGPEDPGLWGLDGGHGVNEFPAWLQDMTARDWDLA